MFESVPAFETNYMVKFKKMDTKSLIKLIKKVRSGKQMPLTLITKEIRNFDRGGKLLSCYYHHNDTLVMEINNKFFPNHQLQKQEKDWDPEELWKFKMRKVPKTEL